MFEIDVRSTIARVFSLVFQVSMTYLTGTYISKIGWEEETTSKIQICRR